MHYQVVATVRVHARDEKEAEKEALEAIVGDLSGWNEGAIRVECRPISDERESPPGPPREARVARHRALQALLRRLLCRHDWERTDTWDADLEDVVVRCRKCGREEWSTWNRAGPSPS